MNTFRFVNILVLDYREETARMFTYKIDQSKYPEVKVGMRAIIPFGNGNRTCEGYITELDVIPSIDESRIKEIIEIPDRFIYFDEEMFKLASWMTEKYCCTLSDAFSTVVPSGVRSLKRKERREKYISINKELENIDEIIEKFSSSKQKENQGKILKLLKEENELIFPDVLSKASVSDSTVKTMIKNNLLSVREDYYTYEEENDELNSNFTKKEVALTDSQNEAVKNILESNKDTLLKGVTGSGKTEVYIKLTDYYTSQGKNVIILVPEIGLTPQMVKRFEESFEHISIMHSKLSPSEKLVEWKKVKDHKVNVIIGPRSAIFMPVTNIGLIIIDEEHEMTYKSEQTPKYKTKEIAQFRAKENNAKILYGSATPSVESYIEAKTGKLNLVELNERFNSRPMPEIQVVDMKEELEKGNRSIFSNALASAIKERLDKKEQVILFLNRRGFSTFVSCRKCGHVMKCEHCSIPYVFHQRGDYLQCHYCGEQIPNVHTCPVCGSKYIRHFGTGTEKVEEEIQKVFPSARILRMDGDTTSKKDSAFEILDKFKNHEADILVGTQMIAKGHNFENVTLVGIISADIMLNFQDFRAPERTFQLVTQVAGRSGRYEKEGKVIMQTYEPDNYAIEAASNYDYEKFFEMEAFLRKQMKCPPFRYLFYIILAGKDENEVKSEINVLGDMLRKCEGLDKCEVLGPGPAGISKINDLYRYQVIIRGENEDETRINAMKVLDNYKSTSKSAKNFQIVLNFD